MFVSAVSMSRSEVENSPVVRIPHYFDWLSNLVRYFFHRNQEQGDTHNRRLNHSIFDVSSCDVLSCDVFAHFPPNYIFISFVYLTLDDMTFKNIIATLQQALLNEIYLSCVF
jgi:hypothetical protein